MKVKNHGISCYFGAHILFGSKKSGLWLNPLNVDSATIPMLISNMENA